MFKVDYSYFFRDDGLVVEGAFVMTCKQRPSIAQCVQHLLKTKGVVAGVQARGGLGGGVARHVMVSIHAVGACDFSLANDVIGGRAK